MTQRLNVGTLVRLWLSVLAIIVSGCQPTEEPIPAVERPATSSSAVRPAAGSSNSPAITPGAIAEKVVPQSPHDLTASSSAVKVPGVVDLRPEPVRDEAGREPWLGNQTSLPLEYWEALYRNAQRIGVTQYKLERDNKNRLRLNMTTHMPVIGGAKPIKRLMRVESVEQPTGQMESFTETMEMGQGISQVQGSVTNQTLRMEVKASTGNSSQQLTLPAGAWGPMGIHQLLMRRPMKPGEARIAQVFLSQLHQVAKVTLVAGEAESTTSPDGLLTDVIPIEALMQLEKEGIRVRMWIDREGKIQKTMWPEGLNFSSFRITPEVGQRMVDEGEYELLKSARIDTAIDVSQVQSSDKVVYHIGSSQSDPHELFSSQTNQLSRSATAYEAKVTVVKPQVDGQALVGIEQRKPGPECNQSSTLIDSDTAVVKQLALSLAADERVPHAVATVMNSQLFQYLKPQKSDGKFHRASEVCQLKMADAPEAAMLLTALLRSREIPARVASGIRLQPEGDRHFFVFHMWTEAWIGDRWLPLDPSTGHLAGCSYIKFLESPLAGSNPYTVVLPVLASLEKLKITIEK